MSDPAPARAALRREPLRLDALLAFVSSSGHGAVASFLGVVRDRHEGRGVVGVTYDAFEPLAARCLGELAAEAAERFGARVAVEHRFGRLAVGEASLAIAAGAPHRGPALDACRWVLEEVKLRLPVWKREHYESGDSRWLSGCALPHAQGS
ncbi:MAG: molybdenum cofactor biosynthesis protein MoaE [Elusimicrobia bacterium]|nr:molybdenum cofactor biosynthesis protein MoaE [Elusimicrobiota bacterium]